MSMMDEQFERTEALLGAEALDKLNASHVAVFGVGGVGSHCVLALARAGVGRLTLVDGDGVAPSNINRQAIAFHSTLGKRKVDVAAKMIADINPDCVVETRDAMVMADDVASLMSSFVKPVDYVIDAIDAVQTKVELARYSQEAQVPLVSCAGTAGKLDAQAFTFADIYQTSECPLCRRLRSELRKAGVEHLEVLYSTEKAHQLQENANDAVSTRPVLGTVSYVPSCAGLLLAGHVIKQLIGR